MSVTGVHSDPFLNYQRIEPWSHKAYLWMANSSFLNPIPHKQPIIIHNGQSDISQVQKIDDELKKNANVYQTCITDVEAKNANVTVMVMVARTVYLMIAVPVFSLVGVVWNSCHLLSALGAYAHALLKGDRSAMEESADKIQKCTRYIPIDIHKTFTETIATVTLLGLQTHIPISFNKDRWSFTNSLIELLQDTLPFPNPNARDPSSLKLKEDFSHHMIKEMYSLWLKEELGIVDSDGGCSPLVNENDLKKIQKDLLTEWAVTLAQAIYDKMEKEKSEVTFGIEIWNADVYAGVKLTNLRDRFFIFKMMLESISILEHCKKGKIDRSLFELETARFKKELNIDELDYAHRIINEKLSSLQEDIEKTIKSLFDEWKSIPNDQKLEFENPKHAQELDFLRQFLLCEEVSFYDLFNIEENASEASIKKRYRELSVIFHPDKIKGNAEGAVISKIINTIYRELIAIVNDKENSSDEANNGKEEIVDENAKKLSSAPFPSFSGKGSGRDPDFVD